MFGVTEIQPESWQRRCNEYWEKMVGEVKRVAKINIIYRTFKVNELGQYWNIISRRVT